MTKQARKISKKWIEQNRLLFLQKQMEDIHGQKSKKDFPKVDRTDT